jgi:hypothetical protein
MEVHKALHPYGGQEEKLLLNRQKRGGALIAQIVIGARFKTYLFFYRLFNLVIFKIRNSIFKSFSDKPNLVLRSFSCF